MFIYLSKKIAIPHNVRLSSCSWNTDQGWIACGGANGLLKVLKLEGPNKKKKKKTDGAQRDLSMNQSLEGHMGNVINVTWNATYRKLTTSDEQGLIIVWMLHKGMWYEEMINNRNKSVVCDMKWTADGQKICIIYEDGAVIVGSVDGNRLWGKELNTPLWLVEWSPDGRVILFGTQAGEVTLYDYNGSYLTKMQIHAVAPGSARLVGLDWYNGLNGFLEPNVPCLAVCFDNGRAQIMRTDTDDNPVFIDSQMEVRKIAWNFNGSVLAIAGCKLAAVSGEAKDSHQVQFYNPHGKHLRTLRIPGSSAINAISWEGGGLRLALAVDSFIFFANIRPDYEWGYFAGTVVFSYLKADRAEHCVCFWAVDSNERHVKYVKNFMMVRSAGEHCVFVTRAEDAPGQYILILCNAIGSPVDSKYIDIEPVFVSMTPYHLIVASNDEVYVWQFRSAVVKSTLKSAALARKEGREKSFHIDDQIGAEGVADMVGGGEGIVSQRVPRNRDPSNDPICSVTANKNVLLVARSSGAIQRYSLPHLQVEYRPYVVASFIQTMALNCNSTRVALIDANGILTCLDMEARPDGADGIVGQLFDFERKDVWDIKWADDNPELFACMEKTRMYVFRGLEPEEPVTSSGFLCSFNDLEIRTILLDEVMTNPANPDKECVIDFETKSLRDTRELLATVPIAEAFQFIEDRPHVRLWRILAETALEHLNFSFADKAFVRCADYQGVQFVKRLKLLPDRQHQRAEVCAYFKRFDEAEEIFLQMEQRQLAVDLRQRLGDWFRVVKLVESHDGNDEQTLIKAWDNIGEYYSDRQKWQAAFQWFVKSKNLARLIDCAYTLDDYEALAELLEQIPVEETNLLRSVADKFLAVGLCSEAVLAFLKAGDPKAAVDACVVLNQWDQAVSLAEHHNFKQIEGLLTKYASHLLSKKKQFQVIELYRKANRYTDAARLLSGLAKQVGDAKVDPLRAKKLYVLAALEADRYKTAMIGDMTGAFTGKQTTAQTLQSLINLDQATGDNKQLESPWHGAEAFHFWILAQRQLYDGDFEGAMRTALRLTEYEDVLDTRDIYSVVALTTFHAKYLGECSRAFIKLESLDNATADEKEQYKKLAMSIFTRYAPQDPAVRKYPCPNDKCGAAINGWQTRCNDCNAVYAGCLITGRPIISKDATHCRTCKHRMYQQGTKVRNCPLCHTRLRGANETAAQSKRLDQAGYAAAAAGVQEDERDIY